MINTTVMAEDVVYGIQEKNALSTTEVLVLSSNGIPASIAAAPPLSKAGTQAAQQGCKIQDATATT